MQLYLLLQDMLGQLWPARKLTLAERGCLAMAAQALTEDDGTALERLRRSVQRGSSAFVCHQLLMLTRQDFDSRVRTAGLASDADVRLVEITCRLKAEKARSGQLNDFLLTSQYRFFPAFYRWYDTFSHTLQ